MKYYPDITDEFDLKELKKLNAEDWMIDLLKLNPSYCNWGPHEDYMMVNDGSWSSPCFFESWKDFDWGLDDLNEVVNFYFEVGRECEECTACERTGYNPETRQISEDWYDFADTGRKWCNNITQDEVDALVERGRLSDISFSGNKLTAKEVNDLASGKVKDRHIFGLLGHDAINKNICVKTRAKRLGVYGLCEKCEGDGIVYTKPSAQVNLILWVLHPRKGCSRGIEIKNIQQEEISEILSYLKEAHERNTARFSNVLDKVTGR